jgi:hypothetical protein
MTCERVDAPNLKQFPAERNSSIGEYRAKSLTSPCFYQNDCEKFHYWYGLCMPIDLGRWANFGCKLL